MDRPSLTLYVLIFLGAVLASLLLTPVARRCARRWGIQDDPGRGRSHLEPVSLMGGLAIYSGAFLAAWLLLPAARIDLKGFFLAGLVVLVFGLQDDMTPMDPSIKLMAQASSALVLVGFGTQIQLTAIPLIDVFLSVVWVVVVVNAFNYSDNMNGLASGLAAVSSLGFFILALIGDQYLVAVLSIALAGGALGFLPSNFPHARIFMGDAGSLFLGLTLAFLGIRLRFLDRPESTTVVLPVLMLIVPLFDAGLVTLSRLRRGVPVTCGGADHVSHRLVAAGMKPASAVGCLWLAQAVSCAAGVVVLSMRSIADAVVIVAIFTAIVACAFFFERVSVTRLLPRGVNQNPAPGS
ncbi:MAG: glycosyltransferase family 4 protein [Acidimicrobiales bacterium]